MLRAINQRFNCFTVGVDPAKNLKITQNKNMILFRDYFNFKFSIKLKKKFKNFNYIIARNVLAHVPDPNEIFKATNNLLTNKGIFILEVPHLENIIRHNQYDNIFHEHIGFHSLKSIVDLSTRHNLRVFKVEKINSQGGSLRCYISKQKLNIKVSKNISKIITKEKKLGLFSRVKLLNFKIKILLHIKKMQELIKKLKKKNKKISVYGASGKGQALLQFCKLDNSLLDFTFDKNKLKQKCLTPGTYIKVKDPKEINKTKTEYLLLLSWNIKDEIFKQEREFIKKGGKFIIPFPSPRVINQ